MRQIVRTGRKGRTHCRETDCVLCILAVFRCLTQDRADGIGDIFIVIIFGTEASTKNIQGILNFLSGKLGTAEARVRVAIFVKCNGTRQTLRVGHLQSIGFIALVGRNFEINLTNLVQIFCDNAVFDQRILGRNRGLRNRARHLGLSDKNKALIHVDGNILLWIDLLRHLQCSGQSSGRLQFCIGCLKNTRIETCRDVKVIGSFDRS